MNRPVRPGVDRPERQEDLVGPLWALGAACVMALVFLAAWAAGELVLLATGR